ncbi:hypothetical protein B0F90DRAFT_1674369 [Multifurca ochricompacta]|uniref:Uncharacterized protein n=1 Tax=Multifurca ochricompacta TaxID=376703 RepID=A0AAD4QT56_9AGAM|nr:hypothetical protein B0F90DRAFT_1674369 [Multifurca ochricompacta]
MHVCLLLPLLYTTPHAFSFSLSLALLSFPFLSFLFPLRPPSLQLRRSTRTSLDPRYTHTYIDRASLVYSPTPLNSSFLSFFFCFGGCGEWGYTQGSVLPSDGNKLKPLPITHHPILSSAWEVSRSRPVFSSSPPSFSPSLGLGSRPRRP